MRTTVVIAALLTTLVPTNAFAQASPPREPIRLLRGVVTSTAGARPLPGATVAAAARERLYGQVTSDGQGRFEVPVPDDAEVTVTARKPGFAPATLTVAAGARAGDVRIALDNGAAVNGRILDPRGSPVAGLRVRVTRMDPPESADPMEVLTETSDLGEFRAGGLAAGRYAIAFDPASVFRSAFLSPFAVDVGFEREPGVEEGNPGTQTIVDLPAGQEVAVDIVHDVARAAADYVTSFDRSRRLPAGGAAPDASAASSTGSIAGRVLGPAGEPVAGALVRVTAPYGAVSPKVRLASSDTEGRYEVRGLAAGEFLVSAGKPGFVEAWHGQAGERPGGALVALDAGERRDSIDVALPRGGAVSGTIVDELGEPLEGLTVQLLAPAAPAVRDIAPASGVVAQKTDDRGRYRLYGARPGSYYVRATDVVSPTTARPGPDRSREVYHPGGGTVSEALPVIVGAGVGVSGMDLVFGPGRAGGVRGLVTDSAGRPFNGTVTLSVSRRSGAPVPPSLPTRAVDGAFEFTAVPPGAYVVQASTALPGGPDWEFGMVSVTVTEGAAGRVAFQMSRGSLVAGRITVEDDRPFGQARDVDPSSFVLTASSADLDYAPRGVPPVRPAYIDDDWNFEIANLFGPLRFSLASAPPGWWLKAVYVDGVNAAVDPVNLGPGSQIREDVEVVLSDNGASIAGTVRSDGQHPVEDAWVLVFPVDASRRRRQGFVAAEPADPAGAFQVPGVPPGEYWVAAMEGSDETGLGMAELFERLVPRATRVVLREGQHEDVVLTAFALRAAGSPP
jgi:protocatechuate 3,4-dioxygenase beta subunit